MDNTFTNNMNNKIASGNIITDFSDHYTQFVSIFREKIDYKSIKMYKRDYSKFCGDIFRDDVSIRKFNNHFEDVNDKFNDYFKLEACVERHALLKKLTPKEVQLHDEPWISGDLSMQNLYRYVNGIRVNVLKNTELINSILIQLEVSINRLNKFEEESSKSLARLSADMIITECDLKKLTTKVYKHPEIPWIHEKINNNKNVIAKLNSNEQINVIKNDLESLSSKIKNASKQISTSTHQDTTLHYSNRNKKGKEKCIYVRLHLYYRLKSNKNGPIYYEPRIQLLQILLPNPQPYR